MPGPAVALAGASLASGVIQSKAAGKAPDGARGAAVAANNLQREQFQQTTQNHAPFLNAGKDAMAAYLYEMGLGPRPTFGGLAPKIEALTNGKWGIVSPTGEQPTAGGVSGGIGSAFGMLQDQMLGNVPRKPATGGAGAVAAPTQYRVSGKTFSTLAEAEQYATENAGGIEYKGYSASPMAKYLMQEGVDSIEGSSAAGGGLFSGATLEALEGNRKQVIQADTSDYFSKLFGLTNMGMAAAGNQAGAGAQYAGNVGANLANYANASGNAAIAKGDAMAGTIGDMAGIAGYYSNPMAAYTAPMMASPRPMPNPFY